MKKLTIVTLIAAFCVSNVRAGQFGLTFNSRACLHNESVVWDRSKKWEMFTDAIHIDKTGRTHSRRDIQSKVKRNRSVARCMGEGILPASYWKIHSVFYVRRADGNFEILGDIENDKCSPYQGWWDFDTGEYY